MIIIEIKIYNSDLLFLFILKYILLMYMYKFNFVYFLFNNVLNCFILKKNLLEFFFIRRCRY